MWMAITVLWLPEGYLLQMVGSLQALFELYPQSGGSGLFGFDHERHLDSPADHNKAFRFTSREMSQRYLSFCEAPPFYTNPSN